MEKEIDIDHFTLTASMIHIYTLENERDKVACLVIFVKCHSF